MNIKVDEEAKCVPYSVAFLQMVKSKALQGDAKYVKIIVDLMRETGVLASMISEEQQSLLRRFANPEESPVPLSHEDALKMLEYAGAAIQHAVARVVETAITEGPLALARIGNCQISML